ncbi:MAG: DegT/DnrJ/EryC1/StrS family aminotransferase [candidate division Zixibacteria bacterium]|nr:DegT/DnrJ/EryC1/StrS family aminotransferase [candidate division Zixibacteria bacterium]
MKWRVALSDLNFDHRERRIVNQVIRNRWLTMGEMVKKLERNFANFLGVRHAFGVSSGTAALHLALRTLNIKNEDEVLVPSLSFVASSNAILYVGAKPVFVDITSLSDFNMSCDDLEEKITRKTRAIMVVHYGGYLADMDRIKRIAKKHNLFVIEDAAHAIGAKFKSRMAGGIGDIGCFSFFSNKNMATGEGGMIVTNRNKFAEKIRLLRSHGMTSMTWDRHKGYAYSYDVTELGYNYRMTEINAALGIEQLKKLKSSNRKRKSLIKTYVENLKGTKGLSIPFLNYPRNSAFHLFPILLNKDVDREKFMNSLKKEKIQTSIHYPPIHKFSYYDKNLRASRNKLPLTEHVGRCEVTLPLHPLLKKEDILFVCDRIKRILPQVRR